MNKSGSYFPSHNVDAQADPVTLHQDQVPINTHLKPAGRLIVLVPAEADYTSMTHRVWKLATTTGMRVQFLSLCKDAAQEPTLRRALIATSALIQDGRVCAEVKVEIGTNWVDVVKRNYQTGDMIVCFAEQRVGILHRPLNQILQANLNAPVYILSNLHFQPPSQSNWSSRIIVWTGSLGIIVGSAFLQIQITSLPQAWAQTTLLILSVIFEAWLLWVWNSLF